VNDLYKENSASFLSAYSLSSIDIDGPGNGSAVSPELLQLMFSYAVSFDNLNLLKSNSSSSFPLKLEVYPYLIPASVSPPDLTFKTAAIPFMFYREFTSVPIQSGTVVIPYSAPHQAPALSSLNFPDVLSNILSSNSGVTLIVENLALTSVKNIETDLITDDTLIHAVINIGFSDPDVKDAVNGVLSDENAEVDLNFLVPTTDSAGNAISFSDLEIFHIIEKDGKPSVEKLKIKNIS